MYLGHFGVAYALKRADRRLSLASLFLGAQLLDIIFPVLFLFGVETAQHVSDPNRAFPFDGYVPWSHSLTGTLLWSTAASFLAKREGWRSALVMWIAVFSHWILDFISHERDISILPYGTGMGLGLASSYLSRIMLELLVFGVGAGIYFRVTRWSARHAFLIFALLMTYASNFIPQFRNGDLRLVPLMAPLFIGLALLARWAESPEAQVTARDQIAMTGSAGYD